MEDILIGFKMHCRGWRSIYFMPHQSAFKGSAPINLYDQLNQVLQWALRYVEIWLSQHCLIWYGYKSRHLKCLQRLTYINNAIYPFTALTLVAYCTLLAICLLSGKFIILTICYNNFFSSLPLWILFWNFHFYWFNIPCGIMCKGFNYTTMNCWARHCWPKSCQQLLSFKWFCFVCR